MSLLPSLANKRTRVGKKNQHLCCGHVTDGLIKKFIAKALIL